MTRRGQDSELGAWSPVFSPSTGDASFWRRERGPFLHLALLCGTESRLKSPRHHLSSSLEDKKKKEKLLKKIVYCDTFQQNVKFGMSMEALWQQGSLRLQ